MTTNHPAHGHVSLDRLHQISEILSKAAAQSDGGNLGYAMADAVKLIDGAIAAFGAEPVAWRYRYVHTPKTEENGSPFTTEWKLCDSEDECNPSDCFERQPLYVAPPAPGVPDDVRQALCIMDDEIIAELDAEESASRAAMLQAGNSPVTPDGWIPVSERLPERDVDVQVYCADKKEQMVGYMERNETEGWFRFASLPNGGGVYCKPTHWMPLPAAPQQEVKS